MDITAPAIALLAVAIAGMQWWNSRQQLVLNLFEKRFQVFMDVRKLASEVLQLGRVESKGLINEIVARARFLFGPKLNAELDKLGKLVLELEAGRSTAATEIMDRFQQMTPLFDPYLKMAQRLPGRTVRKG
jgi:hypothetical protein